MAGGIQVGTTAWDPASLRHDKIVREASKEAEKILQERYPGIKRHHKVLKDSLPTKTGACSPDGGAWYYKDKFVAAFEAKKQGPRGNAIERWYKNYFLVSQLSARCPLVTYAIGEGVREGNPIHVILHAAHGGEYNTFRSDGPSCFLQEEGFTFKEIRDSIVQFIEGEIQ
tara:strand:+ start:69 stop:578 length:510 start_codon:yes stop_codon:yes gene_type:complete